MGNIKTYQFRAYTTKSGWKKLDEVLEMNRILYNAALEERKTAYKMSNKYISLYEQQSQFTQIRKDLPEWNYIHQRLGIGALKRLDNSFNSFFRRIKNGDVPGYPRFIGKGRYKTLTLGEVTPSMLKRSIDRKRAYIKIKGLPILTLRTKRPLPEGTPKTLMITKRPTGYVVSMGFEVEQETLPKNGSQIGIDMGVNKRMTLSDGSEVERRELDRRRENRLRRKVSKANRGSTSRKKKVDTLSKETYRNQIRNRNNCHSLTTNIIRKYDRIAVEDLQIKNMVKIGRGLSSSIHAQTWGLITQQLKYKAEYAGREFVRVDPKYTSKTCSNCGIILTKKLETYRLFICEACGLVIDRDINAAINIEVRAFGSSEARGDSAPHAQLSELSPVHVEKRR